MTIRTRPDGKATGRLLDTKRLRLREFRAADVDALYRLNSDRRVMRYIGNGSIDTRDMAERAVARSMKYYSNYPGLGVWPAEERASGAFIGWFCLKYVPATVEVEVGYRLAREAWGQGYASEGARAIVRYAFDKVGLDRIIGLTHPDNGASQRVLQKAGLVDAGWGRYYGRRLRFFVADRPR